MLQCNRAVENSLSATKSIHKAVKAGNVEIAEMHFIDALRFISRALDNIVTITPQGEENQP